MQHGQDYSALHTTRATTETVPAAETLFEQMVRAAFVLAEDLEQLPDAQKECLRRERDHLTLLSRLVEQKLLTDYQAARIREGRVHGLILGNYRVLDRLGAGGMGVVYKGEHIRLRRPVAIKVLTVSDPEQSRILQRFFIEMRSLAQLHHPNIVVAFDAGELASGSDGPALHYLVMEYVQGKDLEELVTEAGPLPAHQACDLIYQVASALAETHAHDLIHRDIKPSNILVTADGQAKLLDFGLARHFRHRVTDPGFILGTVDYMSPEQARNASTVDIRTDIYSLGGTLYWCLSGQLPFPSEGGLTEILLRRLTQAPPSLRAVCPELPAALEDVITRMMALHPDERYATPQVVMRALLPFVSGCSTETRLPPLPERGTTPAPVPKPAEPVAHPFRVLIVDDEEFARLACRTALAGPQIICDEAANGQAAWEALQSQDYDLVLSDIDMPEMTGPDLLRKLRAEPPTPRLKVALMSGRASADEMAELMLAGADDYLSKPLSAIQLIARVRTLLHLKEAQDTLETAWQRTAFLLTAAQ